MPANEWGRRALLSQVQTSEEMLARIVDGSNSYSVAVIEIY
jgi:hypothetical protein